MDEVGFVDAVFAFFGQDDPTDAMLTILKARSEPKCEEIDQIVPSNDADGTDLEYCHRVYGNLNMFLADPDAYIATIDPANPRHKGLVEIAQAHKDRQNTLAVAVAPARSVDLNAINVGARVAAGPPRITPKVLLTAPPTPAPAASASAPAVAAAPTPAPASAPKAAPAPKAIPALAVTKPPAPVAKPAAAPAITGNGPTLGLNPITAEMKSVIGTSEWQMFRGGLITAFDMYLRPADASEREKGKTRIESAVTTIKVLASGQNGQRGKLLAALMTRCFNDLKAKMDPNSDEFRARYYDVGDI